MIDLAQNRTFEEYKNPQGWPDILQAKWEFEELLSIVTVHAPKSILEVGSLFGGTLRHWMEICPRSTIVSVDQLVPESDYRYAHHKQSQDELWHQWASDREVELHVVSGDSHSTLIADRVTKLADRVGKFDFLFLDGDHSYEGVKQDFLTFAPLVKKGGIVAFHDLLPTPHFADVKVWDFWQELLQAGYVCQELYSSRSQMTAHGWPLGIGVVYL